MSSLFPCESEKFKRSSRGHLTVSSKPSQKSTTGQVVPELSLNELRYDIMRRKDSEESVQSSERDRMMIRSTPLLQSKYADCWKRVRVRLRVIFIIKQIVDQMKLYGISFALTDIKALDSKEVVLTKRHNFYASNSSEQIVKEPTPCLILHPNDNFKVFWTFMMVLLLVYTVTIMPFSMAFFEDDSIDGWYILDRIMDSLFLIDVVITCMSAYYDKAGNLITCRSQIFLNYLKTWLIIDLLASFPFPLLQVDQAQSSSPEDFSTFLKLLRLPRLYRLLRVTRVFKLLNQYNQLQLIDKLQDLLSLKQSVRRLIKSFISILLFVHIMACIWYLSANLDDFNPDTWVMRSGYIDSSTATKYIASMYWAFTTITTVGYGDISASTNLEKILAMCWMIFGLYFFSFTIGNLSSMLTSIDTKENVLIHKLALIDEFATEANLDKDLKIRLKHALRYTTEKRGYTMSEKQHIFNELPKNLRHEVAMNMHLGAAKAISFFQERDPIIVASVVPLLVPMYIEKNQFIYQKGEYADEIYFVVKGRISYVYGKENIIIKSIQRGSYFGDIEIVKSIPRKYSTLAVRSSDLLTMNKQLVQMIVNDFPSLWTEMCEVAETKDTMNDRAKIEIQELLKSSAVGEPIDQIRFNEKVNKKLKKLHPEADNPDQPATIQGVWDLLNRIARRMNIEDEETPFTTIKTFF